jgi:hypothetical protein
VVVVVVVVVVSPGTVDDVVVVVVVVVVVDVVVVSTTVVGDVVVVVVAVDGQLLVRTREVCCAGELFPPGFREVVVVTRVESVGAVTMGSVSTGGSGSVGINANVSAGAATGGSL